MFIGWFCVLTFFSDEVKQDTLRFPLRASDVPLRYDIKKSQLESGGVDPIYDDIFNKEKQKPKVKVERKGIIAHDTCMTFRFLFLPAAFVFNPSNSSIIFSPRPFFCCCCCFYFSPVCLVFFFVFLSTLFSLRPFLFFLFSSYATTC
jgi:hypothetical protein